MRRSRHFRISLPPQFLAVLALLLSFVLPTGAAAQTGAYQLNAGDRINVRVVSWDSLELAFVEMGALGGEYEVGQDGRVMLPLVGPMMAMGLTAEELGDAISTGLNARMGMTEPPSTAVQIVGYAPIYVLGDVQDAGQYQFQPGLTAIRALAIAGGTPRLTSDNPNEILGTIRTTGAMREQQIEHARLQLRAARLNAEAEGADEITIPQGLRSPAGPAAIEALIAQENTLFESRRDTIENALTSLEATRALLKTEIASLEEKLEGQERQIELVSQSVGNLESLVDRGLARSPALMTLQQTLINLESQYLDTQTGVFRAQQQISELDRDAADLLSARRLETLRELQQTEAEIGRLATQINVNREILIETGAGSLAMDDTDETAVAITEFRILRDGPDGPEEIVGDASTPLRPFDVLQVTVILPIEQQAGVEPEG